MLKYSLSHGVKFGSLTYAIPDEPLCEEKTIFL